MGGGRDAWAARARSAQCLVGLRGRPRLPKRWPMEALQRESRQIIQYASGVWNVMTGRGA
eukprot:9470740-Pyramimonas_sp.AAC.1